MPQLISLITKIDDLETLLEKDDLNEWEHKFVDSIVRKILSNAGSTTCLTTKQVDKVEELHLKHCG